MRHLARTHEGTLLVEGKSTYVFTLPDGRQVKGSDLQQSSDWPWRSSPQVPGVRYARLLATGACQVQSEESYYGHLVLRLMGCLVLFYTSRVICKGRLTMEEILFSLKHYWRFVDSEALDLKALSWGVDEKAV